MSTGNLLAQSVLSGTVSDKQSGEPLIGASIYIPETEEGTVTDYDGAFELRTNKDYPVKVLVSYIGYEDLEQTVTEAGKLKFQLESSAVTIESVEVKGQRISEKQKAAPLTVESLDVLAIKETPSDNFYDGLGSLKGVDLTAASLGFKIVNTRGFNSTSPV
ncbi:MAG: carboxypeptidase-like regulatory domain-containing protein, partial [Phaeodactylibacter sp.]|nr:carboxypeptidase-like regulatory domain-containing protein [Phaeodactylibacter sp.]